MFGLENLDGWKLVVLGLLAVFLIGPERLPRMLADGVRMLRNLRTMARNATADLSRELGTEITLEDLNPRALVRKHLLSEEDEQAVRAPVQELYRGLRDDVAGVRAGVVRTRDGLGATAQPRTLGASSPAIRRGERVDPGQPAPAGPRSFDPDTT